MTMVQQENREKLSQTVLSAGSGPYFSLKLFLLAFRLEFLAEEFIHLELFHILPCFNHK